MFFEGWYPLFRIAVIGVLGYAFLIAAVRVGGKRTLSQMNTFDFLVNVALGSMFATLILSKDIVLAEGAAAILLLIALQMGVTALTARFPKLRDAVDTEPVLLLRKGQMMRGAMKQQRIGEADMLAAARAKGITDLSDVEFIILETNGNMSVVAHGGRGDSAMRDVR